MGIIGWKLVCIFVRCMYYRWRGAESFGCIRHRTCTYQKWPRMALVCDDDTPHRGGSSGYRSSILYARVVKKRERCQPVFEPSISHHAMASSRNKARSNWDDCMTEPNFWSPITPLRKSWVSQPRLPTKPLVSSPTPFVLYFLVGRNGRCEYGRLRSE
jgi:hypothetical protein